MSNRVEYWSLIAAFTGALLAKAVSLFDRSLSAWPRSPDPIHYLNRVRWTAEHLQPHPLDAPLRYVPWALLFRVPGIESSWTTLNIGVVMTIWVIIPLCLFALSYRLLGKWPAVTTLGITVVIRWTRDVVKSPYWNGPIHNELVIPLCLGVLYCVYQLLTTTAIRRWTIATAVAIGAAGLTQLTNTMLVCGVVGLVLIGAERYKQLTVITGLSAIIMSPHLWYGSVREHTADHVALEGRNLLQPNPDVLLLLFGLALSVLAVLLVRELTTDIDAGNLIAISLGITAVCWMVIWQGLGLPYYMWATRPLRGFMLIVAANSIAFGVSTRVENQVISLVNS